MNDAELKAVETAIANQLIKYVNSLFEKKNINAKVESANTDNDFLYVTVLADVPNMPSIAKINFTLSKSILTNRDSCDKIDAAIGAVTRRTNAGTLVILRILRIIFDMCERIKKGEINELLERKKTNTLNVSFSTARGDVWCF